MKYDIAPKSVRRGVEVLGVAAGLAISLFAAGEAKADSAANSGLPECHIWNVENRWGDCANSHEGGVWSIADGPDGQSCVVLSDWNENGIDSVAACKTGSGFSLTETQVVFE